MQVVLLEPPTEPTTPETSAVQEYISDYRTWFDVHRYFFSSTLQMALPNGKMTHFLMITVKYKPKTANKAAAFQVVTGFKETRECFKNAFYNRQEVSVRKIIQDEEEMQKKHNISGCCGLFMRVETDGKLSLCPGLQVYISRYGKSVPEPMGKMTLDHIIEQDPSMASMMLNRPPAWVGWMMHIINDGMVLQADGEIKEWTKEVST